MLPSGFSELVELSLEVWDWDDLSESIDDIWNSLMTQIFLGPTVRSAQANYIQEVLSPYISYNNAPNVDNRDWSTEVISHIQNERETIQGTSGEGYKNAILTITEKDVVELNLSRTIFDSLNFFRNNRITVRKIHLLGNDSTETKNLVYSASKNIHNVALTKAVLWLYGCGIAQELVPPNTHIIGFLNQYGFINVGWDSNSWPPDWQLFAESCDKMTTIAHTVSSTIDRSVTAKQAQAAVWYLQTCRGFISRNNRGKMNPRRLIDFLTFRNWDIKDLENAILDVELIGDLETSLNSFVY